MLNTISDQCQTLLAIPAVGHGKTRQIRLAEPADRLDRMETFKQRMKRIRVRAGLKSQGAAASAIGCERGTVGMWEAPSSNVQAVSAEWLFAVARAYKVRPEWINNLRSGADGYPWVGGAESLSVEPTTHESLAAAPTPSQFGRPDPDILHEALTLLAFSEEQSGRYSGRARTQELCRLYEWVERDGGRLSDASNDAFEASVWARRNRLGGADDRANTPERKRRARG